MWRRAGFSSKKGIRRLSTAVRRNVDDEGDWSYASEWWGGDGADGGHTVFRSASDHGNGVVSVVAYPCSRPVRLLKSLKFYILIFFFFFVFVWSR